MALADLDKGARSNVHIRLYDREIAILDKLVERYDTSRAAVIGELLREVETSPTQPGARGRRSSLRSKGTSQ